MEEMISRKERRIRGRWRERVGKTVMDVREQWGRMRKRKKDGH